MQNYKKYLDISSYLTKFNIIKNPDTSSQTVRISVFALYRKVTNNTNNLSSLIFLHYINSIDI